MYPPNADSSQLFDAPLVDDLLQRQQGEPPLSGPTAIPPVVNQTPEPATGLQKALSVIVPLFAIGQALGGSGNAGAATLHGYQRHQALEEERRRHEAQLEIQRQQEARLAAQETRIAQAQEAERIARERAREEQRQRAIASMITDVTRTARTFTTRVEHDQFVASADAMASQAYGTRPGAIRGAVPFVPVPIRERAQKALDRIRKAAPNGQLAMGGDAGDTTGKRVQYTPLEKATIAFDMDGDGQDERIPFSQLEELAGEAFYSPTGERLVPNQPAPIATYGLTFPQARGTVFADKPLPTDSKGQPDYSKALRDLNALNAGSKTSAADRRQARLDAQTQARDRLYAAVIDGQDEKSLAAQFSGVFSGVGLSYRAELAKIRRDIFSAGSQGLSPEDRELSTTADIMGRGREVLGGGTGPTKPRPAPSPVTSGRGGKPPAVTPGQDWPTTTAKNDYLKLREKALAVLDAEAQRRGLPPGSVTEEQVQTFLKNPENRKRLQR